MDFQFITKLSMKIIPFLRHETFYAGIIFAIVWLLIFLLKKRSLQWHYALWFLVLLRLLLPPNLSFSLSVRNLFFQSQVYEKVINFFELNKNFGSWVFGSENESFKYENSDGIRKDLINEVEKNSNSDITSTILFIVWLPGMLFFLAMYLKNMLHFYKTAKNAGGKTNEKIDKIVEDWRQFFRIKRPVSLVSSQAYLSPFTKGILRPIIFIPEKIISIKDNADFISSIIGHEMSHIKRWDNLWMKLQSLLQIVYFFNPLVWLVNSKINLARECICDQMVLSKKHISAQNYGQGILAVLKMNLIGADEINVLPGFGSQRKKLIFRIKNLRGEKNMGKFQSKIIYASLLLLGLFLLPMAATMVEKESTKSDSSLFAEVLQQAGSETKETITTVKVVKNATGYSIIPVDAKEDEITTQIAFKNLNFVLPIACGKVTAGFGNMLHRLTKEVVHHNGIDIAAPKGTEIYASADGKVTAAFVEYEEKQGPGKYVIITHASGFETFYSHLDKVLIREGQEVKAGEMIGKVGTTGVSTGAHLHFEIKQNGETQNPEKYIDFKKIKKSKQTIRNKKK